MTSPRPEPEGRDPRVARGTTGEDPFVSALRCPEAVDHFHAVVHTPDIHCPDPYDVPTIHAEARDEFVRLIDRARDPERGRSGRSFLVLGEAGAGKTHLLRAFRRTIHGRDAGYVSYLQMTTTLENYERYLLGHVIDALSLPYDDPRESRSGLQRISDRIVDRPRLVPPKVLEQLRSEENPERLRRLVNKVVNRLVLHEPELAGIDSEVLPALVYLQSELPTIRRRVTPLLRCQDLSTTARAELGGIAPLLAPDDPMRVLTHLAALIRFADQGAFVILVDQLETSSADLGAAEALFRRAMQVLCDVVDRIPNCVLVVSCLKDFWSQFEDRLAHSLRDRLRHDPDPAMLSRERSSEEVRAMAAVRLAAAFEDAGLEADPKRPLHPFEEAELVSQLRGKSGREVIEGMRRVITEGEARPNRAALAAPEGADGPGDSTAELTEEWSSFLAAYPNIDREGEAELCELLENALVEAAPVVTAGARCAITRDASRLRVEVDCDDGRSIRFHVALCDRSPRGGGLSRQLSSLEDELGKDPTAILRTDGFQFGPKTKAATHIASLIQKGWQCIAIEDAEWRQLEAFLAFADRHRGNPAWPEWVRDESPVTGGAATSKLLHPAWVDRCTRRPSPSESRPQPRTAPPTPPPQPREPARVQASPEARHPQRTGHPPSERIIPIGRQLGHNPVDLHLDLDRLIKHAAVVGGSGSGKTTFAMHLVEQALLRRIPVLVIDRKGDLASWAQKDALAPKGDDPERDAQRAALAEMIDVRLFTPGDPRGADIALPVLPVMPKDASGVDRDEATDSATAALASMLGYKDTGPSATRRAALRQAVRLLLELRPGERTSLDQLTGFIADEDPSLVASLGQLPPKTLAKLAEDLTVLALNNPRLLSKEAPELSGAELLGKDRNDGRIPLTIISTIGLGSNEGLLFWITRLFGHLSRYAAQSPEPSLQALVVLDEADLYLPATRQPPTKPEIEGALKRWRSAGLGLVLSSQSPADFDYRCRDNIGTWAVGLVKESNAHKKLAPLFSTSHVTPEGRLPRLAPGQFVVVSGSDVSEVQAPLSLTPSTQLPQDRIRELATPPR